MFCCWLLLAVAIVSPQITSGFQPVAITRVNTNQQRTGRSYWKKPSLVFPQDVNALLTPSRLAATTNNNGEDDADGYDEVPLAKSRDTLVLKASKTLQRTSWISWWAQVILSVVSSVTLVFAQSVTRSSKQKPEGLLLAGVGMCLDEAKTSQLSTMLVFVLHCIALHPSASCRVVPCGVVLTDLSFPRFYLSLSDGISISVLTYDSHLPGGV